MNTLIKLSAFAFGFLLFVAYASAGETMSLKLISLKTTKKHHQPKDIHRKRLYEKSQCQPQPTTK